MTKHAAYPSEDVVAAMAASTPPGQHFTSIPPLKGAPLDCKKHADMDLLRLRGCRRKTPIGIGALAQFEVLLAAAKGKQIVMFLDYDGTLSPIVEDPDCAVMSEEMREVVRRVAEHFPTTIVSGRCRDKGIGIPVCPDSLRRRRHGGILLAE
ncbi:hypothetical protein BDA96_02G400200 [Sorghum bicolor]|uniref:Trehalose 6-phosphate phosphatase n=1 Tax=Sorghum bicolor TaxID=4558 RepID=A0A921RTY3_SORBI|nr:hypothetical protein BDA96_02G400200 [Sorghum bicolor]